MAGNIASHTGTLPVTTPGHIGTQNTGLWTGWLGGPPLTLTPHHWPMCWIQETFEYSLILMFNFSVANLILTSHNLVSKQNKGSNAKFMLYTFSLKVYLIYSLGLQLICIKHINITIIIIFRFLKIIRKILYTGWWIHDVCQCRPIQQHLQTHQS